MKKTLLSIALLTASLASSADTIWGDAGRLYVGVQPWRLTNPSGELTTAGGARDIYIVKCNGKLWGGIGKDKDNGATTAATPQMTISQGYFASSNRDVTEYNDLTTTIPPVPEFSNTRTYSITINKIGEGRSRYSFALICKDANNNDVPMAADETGIVQILNQ